MKIGDVYMDNCDENKCLKKCYSWRPTGYPGCHGKLGAIENIGPNGIKGDKGEQGDQILDIAVIFNQIDLSPKNDRFDVMTANKYYPVILENNKFLDLVGSTIVHSENTSSIYLEAGWYLVSYNISFANINDGAIAGIYEFALTLNDNIIPGSHQSEYLNSSGDMVNISATVIVESNPIYPNITTTLQLVLVKSP